MNGTEKPEFETGIKRLSLDSLTVDWLTNVRADANLDVTGLADSIERHGLQHPIVARPSSTAPGMYEIVEGSRRVSAYRALSQKDPRYKKIEARILEDCDDVQATLLSFDENDKRGDLNAREVHAYIRILLRNAPDNGRKGLAWVAQKLGWVRTGGGKRKREYPDTGRVRKAIEDGEFQTLVPDVELKYRSRGDIDKRAVPITVARKAKQAIYAARAKSTLDEEGIQRQLSGFLLAYAKATPPKLRRAFMRGFVENPDKPIDELLREITIEASKPGLEIMIPVKIPMTWAVKIDEWQHKHDGWTRSTAVRDLIGRSIEALDL